MKKYSFLTPEIQKSLSASWREGIAGNLMIVIVDYYLIPFALFLGAGTREVGFLVALPHLLGSASQLLAVRAVNAVGSRLHFIVVGALFQSTLLFGVASLAVFPIPWRIEILIFLASIFRISGYLIGTAWGSLVSDYLPPQERGRYFGWRAQIAGAAGVFGLASAGVLLNGTKNFSPALGFWLLFLLASTCRFFSMHLFKQMAELPHRPSPENEFTFYMFLRRFRESNFVKFVLYVSSITFATHLAAPYFSVFMLKDLKFSYLTYMSIHLCSVISSLVSFPLWGREADRAGNAKVLKITSFLIPVIPFLWLFSTHPVYLMGVELCAGFVWGGFNLCVSNFVFDAVTPEKRVRCIGYFNFINGVALSVGAALGGLLAERVPVILGHRLYFLFALSGLLRLAAHFFLSGRFKEVRGSVEKTSSVRLFFSVLGIRSLSGQDVDLPLLPLIKRPFTRFAGKKKS